MDSNFFILIGLSILSYGLHRPLLTLYVRKLDGLTIVVYRNISFIITMLPLLFFTTFNAILEILNYVPTLIFASFSAIIAFVTSLNASKNLPVGINASIRQTLYIVFSIFLGYFFFNELISLKEGLLIIVILVAAISLSIMKIDISHLKYSNVSKGLFLVFISGIFHTLAFFFFSKLSRNLSPFVATYFWEVSIGIFALIFILIFGGKYNVPKLKILPKKDMTHIILIALLAIVGTLSYSFAINYGNFAIASSLMTTTIVVNIFGAYFLFKEKFNVKQIGAISLIVIGIMAFKLIS